MSVECGCNEAVAVRQRLNEPGITCRIIKGFADFIYGCIQAVIEVNEGVGSPEGLFQLIAADGRACVFQQNHQNLKGLRLQPDSDAALAKLLTYQVHVIRAKVNGLGSVTNVIHVLTPGRG